jgi:hypothetical protein
LQRIFDYLSYWRSSNRSIEKRQSFAQLTTVEVISAHFRRRLEFVQLRHCHTAEAQGTRREHNALLDASLFRFLLAKSFDGTQFQGE